MYTDKLGRQLKLGDVIIYGQARAYLALGIIEKLIPSKNITPNGTYLVENNIRIRAINWSGKPTKRALTNCADIFIVADIDQVMQTITVERMRESLIKLLEVRNEILNATG
jgi:hypothetical protein